MFVICLVSILIFNVQFLGIDKYLRFLVVKIEFRFLLRLYIEGQGQGFRLFGVVLFGWRFFGVGCFLFRGFWRVRLAVVFRGILGSCALRVGFTFRFIVFGRFLLRDGSTIGQNVSIGEGLQVFGYLFIVFFRKGKLRFREVKLLVLR